MNNTKRRALYLVRRYPALADPAEFLRRAYRDGTPDRAYLTPAQCRRIRHKRQSG